MNSRPRFAIIAFYIVVIALLVLFLEHVVMVGAHLRRGIWFPGDPLPAPIEAESPLGTTVDLVQYETEEELQQALDSAEALGVHWLRMELPWDRVETERGRYEWEPWDRAIRGAARDFQLILTLNRTPEWARQPAEEVNPLAPPAQTADFARFAGAAAERYGAMVTGWQIWDEPNLMPHWGTGVNIDPAQYAAFLKESATAIRANDPDAIVATAGLAPTTEPGGWNMSELRYLQGLYEAGADRDFDVVALKPFGFGMGATDRLYDAELLNFDRVVLAREVMERNDDAEAAVWFVGGGWALLPEGWQGDPAPWSSDGPHIQPLRLEAAIRRAALEWPWVHVIALQLLQPDVAPTDPHWGLALLDENGRVTEMGEVFGRLSDTLFEDETGDGEQAQWATVTRPALQNYDKAAILLVAMIALLAMRLGWHTLRLPWTSWGVAFRRQPEWFQIAAFALLSLLFYFTSPVPAALLLYSFLGILIAWRLDLGLAAVAFATPFFLLPKWFGVLRFSMVELLLLLCLVVWLAHSLRQGWKEGWKVAFREFLWPRTSLDWSLVVFVGWAAVSVFWAEWFGIAAREARVVVLESVLYYWVLRRAGLNEVQRWRVVDALVLAGTLVALYGLYQWLAGVDIIRAEGVHRVRAFYGSPNNLALFLDRVLPISLAVALLGVASRRRRGYALAVAPVAFALFLTFSRGAWLLGLPAGLLFLAWWSGKRARLWIAFAGAGIVLALLPFLATERISSTVDFAGGTWFIRMRLWQATLDMLRDYPLLGVGLDNFLYLYDRYRLPDAWREPDLSHPHQIVLHFWVALGLPGVLLLLWQQVAYWRSWRQQMRLAMRNLMARSLLIGLGASMAATLAHGLIDNSFFLVDLAFVWMLTLAVTADATKA